MFSYVLPLENMNNLMATFVTSLPVIFFTGFVTGKQDSLGSHVMSACRGHMLFSNSHPENMTDPAHALRWYYSPHSSKYL